MSILFAMLRGVRFDMDQHRHHLGVGLQDVSLDPTRDRMPFGHRRGLGHLQVEIDLEAVAQAPGPERMKSVGTGGRQNMLTKVAKDVGGRGGIEQILA